MILPTKHLSVSRSLIGIGAEVLLLLERSQNISSLWYKIKIMPNVRTFENFTLALDFLFMINAIKLEGGYIKKTK